MCPGAAGFALGVGFRFLRPLSTCDQALPRPTEGEDTQGELCCAGALPQAWPADRCLGSHRR
jgi:hypothetical protein